VVLEPGQDPALTRIELDLDRHVADQPRPVLADRVEVDQTDARKLLLAELVGVTQQLVTATHREDHAAARGDGMERVPLDLRQIKRAQPLVPILAPADVVEICAVRIKRVAEAAGHHREADPSPVAALLE